MYLQEGDEESNLPKEDSAVLDPAATETTLLAHESSENTEEGTQPAETTGNDQPDEEEDVNGMLGSIRYSLKGTLIVSNIAADLEDPEQNDTGPIDNIITDDQQQQPLEEITEDSGKFARSYSCDSADVFCVTFSRCRRHYRSQPD